jgi:uncharacterized protein
MLIEGQFAVAAPPHALIGHLLDAGMMASCLPGCQSLEPLSDDRYRAVVVVGIAGISARFNLTVEITRRSERSVWSVTRGEEGGNASSLHAESQVSLEPAGDGTLVSYRSEVSLTGRLGRFGLGMMKKKAQSLGEEFALNLRTRIEQLPGDIGRAADPILSAPPARRGAPWLPRWWHLLLGWLRGRRQAGGTGPRS